MEVEVVEGECLVASTDGHGEFGRVFDVSLQRGTDVLDDETSALGVVDGDGFACSDTAVYVLLAMLPGSISIGRCRTDIDRRLPGPCRASLDTIGEPFEVAPVERTRYATGISVVLDFDCFPLCSTDPEVSCLGDGSQNPQGEYACCEHNEGKIRSCFSARLKIREESYC